MEKGRLSVGLHDSYANFSPEGKISKVRRKSANATDFLQSLVRAVNLFVLTDEARCHYDLSVRKNIYPFMPCSRFYVSLQVLERAGRSKVK